MNWSMRRGSGERESARPFKSLPTLIAIENWLLRSSRKVKLCVNRASAPIDQALWTKHLFRDLTPLLLSIFLFPSIPCNFSLFYYILLYSIHMAPYLYNSTRNDDTWCVTWLLINSQFTPLKGGRFIIPKPTNIELKFLCSTRSVQQPRHSRRNQSFAYLHAHSSTLAQQGWSSTSLLSDVTSCNKSDR